MDAKICSLFFLIQMEVCQGLYVQGREKSGHSASIHKENFVVVYAGEFKYIVVVVVVGMIILVVVIVVVVKL